MKSYNKNPKDCCCPHHHHLASSPVARVWFHSLSIFVSRGRALPLFASLDLTKFYSCFDLVYPIHFVWCWPSDIFPRIIYPPRALPPNLHSFSSHIRTTFSKSDVYCFNYIIWTSWYLYFEIYLIFVLFE